MTVLDIIKDERLVERANYIGQGFNDKLSALKAAYPSLISEVRNQGAMIVIELIEDGDKERPNTTLTQAIIANAAKHGLILLSCNFYGNVIRFLPLLTISDDILDERSNVLLSN